MDDYQVVFDILDHGYTEWKFALPGLIFTCVGLILRFFPRWRAFGRFFVWFSILWIVGALGLTYETYLDAVAEYKAGKYELVQGKVESTLFQIGDKTVSRYKVGDRLLWGSELPMEQDFVQPLLGTVNLKEGMDLKIFFDLLEDEKQIKAFLLVF